MGDHDIVNTQCVFSFLVLHEEEVTNIVEWLHKNVCPDYM